MPDITIDISPVVVKKLFSYLNREEPAAAAWAVNGGLALLLGNFVHLTATQGAAVTTGVTAVVALFTMFRTTPAAVGMLTGTLSALAAASATFGLHLQPVQVSVAVAVMSGLMGLMTRANVSPKNRLH